MMIGLSDRYGGFVDDEVGDELLVAGDALPVVEFADPVVADAGAVPVEPAEPPAEIPATWYVAVLPPPVPYGSLSWEIVPATAKVYPTGWVWLSVWVWEMSPWLCALTV